jgi:hypothetical protein
LVRGKSVAQNRSEDILAVISSVNFPLIMILWYRRLDIAQMWSAISAIAVQIDFGWKTAEP